MNFRRLTRASRRRAQLDAVVTAYVAWRRECADVHAAYATWKRAGKADASAAFASYQTALDREERAAREYACLVPRIRHRADLDVARQLAQLPAPSTTR